MRGIGVVVWLAVAACRGGFDPIAGGPSDDAHVAPPTNPCGEGTACSWSAGAFGMCSDSCTTGTQMRSVECHDPSGQPVDAKWCDAATRPADAQACTETSCAWTMDAWSGCSANCGGGMQQRSVECRTSAGLVVPDAYCTGGKPAAAQSCNTQSCCQDLNNTIHELPGDGATACSTAIRYFTTNDTNSMTRRCTELGWAAYGNFNVQFTQAQWCMYCNARTKIWNGTSWVVNGCTNPVNTLRCCNTP